MHRRLSKIVFSYDWRITQAFGKDTNSHFLPSAQWQLWHTISIDMKEGDLFNLLSKPQITWEIESYGEMNGSRLKG